MADRSDAEPLPEDVAATLSHLLQPHDPVHAALLTQIAHATVQSRCGCGCATVYFDLDVGVVAPGPVDPARHPIVAEAGIVAPDGQHVGEVLVFARDGYLSWLEVCSWSDVPITALPPLDQIEPYNR